jgi:hypothetical protein
VRFTVAQAKVGAALVLGVALLALVEFVVSQRDSSPHDGEGTCSDCHLNDAEKADAQGEELLMVEDVAALCRRCHDVNPGLSHPWNVPASQQPPADFPLDWAGRVTCSTCHYTHREGRPDVTGYMIRTENIGRAFCQQCHDVSAAAGGKHSAVLDTSHVGEAGPETEARAMLDQASLQCLGCHDGTVAEAAAFSSPGSGATWQHGQIGLSHPIGVEYSPARSRRSRYRPVAQLDRRVRLFDGKLGCCSCHEPYSDAKHGLVMSNAKSALCLECHQK